MNRHMMHPYMRPRQYYREQNPYGDEAPREEAQAPMTEDEEVLQRAMRGEEARMERDAEARVEEEIAKEREEDQPEEALPEGNAEALEQAKKEIEEERLRMAAEMDNFRKRLRREHEEQMRYAAEKVLSELLPALDNLDLAIQYGSSHDACKDMMQGIEMTRRQLLEAVGKSGLISVGERGEEFDPAIHEAIGMEASPDLPKGAVSRVLQRGYKLNDRLMRPAKVMVNN